MTSLNLSDKCCMEEIIISYSARVQTIKPTNLQGQTNCLGKNNHKEMFSSTKLPCLVLI